MRKYIYGGALMLALSTAVTSCGKSTNNNFYEKESVKATEKTGGAADTDLIKAIKGQTGAYVAILDLEDYLYDNAKLSDAVVFSLNMEQRVPDYVVETALVLSAPISQANKSALAAGRPNIPLTAITKADNIPASVGFAIINTEHRTIIFGNDIVKIVKPGNEGCNCGDGVVTIGSNYTGITLTTSVLPADPADPTQMRKCDSDNPKWVCGDVVYATGTGTDGSSSNWSIQCRQSTNKCFKMPRNARYNNY